VTTTTNRRELLDAAREAERDAVKALRRLEMAYRAVGASYATPTPEDPDLVVSIHRKRAMLRAECVLRASEAIHGHQAEKIVVRRTDPLKRPNR
jgi:hypothetical protein